MPDINSSQVCLTPYEEDTSSKEKKELEAAASANEPVFWPPPYIQHAVPAEQTGMDMYPFSANYREAGNGTAPNQVNVPNLQGGNDCKHKKSKMSHWLMLALAMLIVGCAGYQLGKRCGFWKGYRHGFDDYYRRERGCRDEDGRWRYETRYHDDDWDDDRHHERHDGDWFDWGLEGHDERYRFGGRDGGQTCEFRRREEEERRAHMDVCTHGTVDRRMMEWDNREGGYSYHQIVRDPMTPSEPPSVLEAIETTIEGRQVFMILDDGLRSQVGDFGAHFPEYMSRCNHTLAQQQDVVDFDSSQIHPFAFRWEDTDPDHHFFQEARTLLDGMIPEDAELRRLVPDTGDSTSGTQSCSQFTQFMLPFNFNIESVTDSFGVDMALYDICVN